MATSDPRLSVDPLIVEELDRVFGKPQFEDQPPAGRGFYKPEPGRNVKVLPKIAPRESASLGDNVVLPKHYSRFQIEPVRFIGENQLNFFQGNVVKYILRYDAKNGIEDVRKAKRYARMFELFLMGHPEWHGIDPVDKELKDRFEAIYRGLRELINEELADHPEKRGQLLAGVTRLEAKYPPAVQADALVTINKEEK